MHARIWVPMGDLEHGDMAVEEYRKRKVIIWMLFLDTLVQREVDTLELHVP